MPTLTDSITIHAPKSAVLAVAKDNEAFPAFMDDVQSLRVVERSPDGHRVVSEWVGVVPRFHATVKWTEEDVWDDDAGTCTFRQLTGDYDKFAGVWTFTAIDENTTRFDSTMEYALEIPLVGGLIQGIIKKTMEYNLRATLTAIKSRSEEKSTMEP